MSRLPLFDSHAHLQDPRLEAAPGGLEGVRLRAVEAGLTHVVCCGTREEDWAAVLALTQAWKAPQVLPFLGLHPWYVAEARSGWEERLERLLRLVPSGVGECGLDGVVEVEAHLQVSALRLQWRLARELDRPLSLHCRKAFDPLAALAREEGLPRAGAVIHAYSGSAEQVRELQALGFHFAFGCTLGDPNSRRSARAVAAVAAERLLLETDAPDGLPRHREGWKAGDLCEPALVVLALEAAARLRGEELEVLGGQVQANSQRFFGRLAVAP